YNSRIRKMVLNCLSLRTSCRKTRRAENRDVLLDLTRIYRLPALVKMPAMPKLERHEIPHNLTVKIGLPLMQAHQAFYKFWTEIAASSGALIVHDIQHQISYGRFV